jgi:hypothetical protein
MKWSNIQTPGWKKLEPFCFHQGTQPTLQDKLMIVAHGSPDNVGGGVATDGGYFAGENGYYPFELAEAMSTWGIEAIGLISFKCCDVGKGQFLEDFIRAAKKVGLKIGWVKGYTGAATTARNLPFVGKPTEYITTPKELFFGKSISLPVTGSDRFKIVKGTHPFTVPSSRYFADSDDK